MAVTVNTVNGVSMGKKYTVTAADASAGYVTFEVLPDPGYEVAFSVMITSAAGVNVPLEDAAITFPTEYSIKIADGAATYATTATDVIRVIASPVE